MTDTTKTTWHIYIGKQYIKPIQSSTYDTALAVADWIVRTYHQPTNQPVIVIPHDDRIKRKDRQW